MFGKSWRGQSEEEEGARQSQDKKEIVVWVDLGLGLRNKRRKGRREMPRGKITGLKRRERRDEKNGKKIIPFYAQETWVNMIHNVGLTK